MIPRVQLFANPHKAAATLSPDGAWLSWAATAGGVMNVWVAPWEAPGQARQLTFDTKRGVAGHTWAHDSRHILFSQDQGGDENFQLHAIDVTSGERRCLTPYPGTRAGLVARSQRLRDVVLISLNRRDPRFGDLFRLHLPSGELELVAENPGFSSFVVDENFQLRFATRATADGGADLLRRESGGQWALWSRVEPDDVRTTGFSHLDASGCRLYIYDSRGRDTTALVEHDLQTGATQVLASSALADIGGLITDSRSHRPLAYRVHHERPELYVLDDAVRADVDFLDAQNLGDWWPAGRTEDDRRWLVSASSDRHPGATYLYDRTLRQLTKLYDLRPGLAEEPLARMQSLTLTSRDGWPLVCYLTLPRELDTGLPFQAIRPAPLVVHVHGGPWTRDHFGYNSTHQWLADRGYAVLNVNFRSSTGLGKAFVNAGDGEWGRKMDDDIDDAVDWAVAAGLADPDRLGILGMSYGGYAVLSALTRRPERYACGVDIVGPSNLETLMGDVPPHWESRRRTLYRAVGDPDTAAGLALLRERSPLHSAGTITAPLLIGQGANDPRVKQSESDQMVQALVERCIPVSYALFPDEGHGFNREPNRMVFNALTEAFLARHLGGRLEPFGLADFPGNSLKMLHGHAG